MHSLPKLRESCDENINDSSVHLTHYSYDVVCKKCGETIETGLTETEEEDHNFNSDGICRDCGYERQIDELKISLSVSSSTVKVGDTIVATATVSGGAGDPAVYWNVTCNGTTVLDTSINVKSVDVTADKAGEYVFTATAWDDNGNQSTATATVTAEPADCEHDNTERTYTDTEYEQIAGNEENHNIYKYYDVVCSDCGETIETHKCDGPETEAHHFDANGTCTDCGYVKATNPDELKISLSVSSSTVKVGETIIATATVTGGAGDPAVYWNVTCNGTTVLDTSINVKSIDVTADEAGEYVITATAWDDNGNQSTATATVTAIPVGCKHENTERVDTAPEYEQIEGNEENHNVYRYYDVVCSDCGETIETHKCDGPETEAHHFDANGKCTDCGYVKAAPSDELRAFVDVAQTTALVGEALEASATATGGDGKYKFAWKITRDDEEIHTTDTSIGPKYSWPADEAGTYVFTVTVVDGEGTTATADGAPIEVIKCLHEHTKEIELEDPSYTNNGDSGHTKTVKVRIECEDCGAVLEDGTIVSYDESHDFSNGPCPCGQSDHVHHYEKVEIRRSNYVNETTEKHKVTITYVERCTGCGDQSEEKTKDITEEHQFTITGGIEAEHWEGMGHKTYDNCVCGAAKYTGYSKLATCSQCHEHSYKTKEISRSNYEYYDQNYHKVTIEYYQQCTTCGHKTDRYRKVAQENHKWGEAYQQDKTWYVKCELCGAKKITQVEKEVISSIEEMDPTISKDKVSTLVAKSNSLVKQRYNSLHEKQESIRNAQAEAFAADIAKSADLFSGAGTASIYAYDNNNFATHNRNAEAYLYAASTDALIVLDNPVKALYYAVTDGEKREEEFTLERAILEMLYGVEYGNTTLSEKFQQVDTLLEYAEKPFDIISDHAGNINDTADQIIETLKTKKENLNEVFSLIYSPSGADHYRNVDLDDITNDEWNYFLRKYNEDLDLKFGGKEIPQEWLQRKETLQEFADFYGNTNSGKITNNVKKSAESLDNIMKVAGISIDALKTCIACVGNDLQASEENAKIKASQNKSLVALTSDRLNKIYILNKLIDQLEPGSALYNACNQVRKDIDNDLSGLNSTATREALYNNAELVTEFTCGVALTTVLDSTTLAGSLDVVEAAKFIVEIGTGGGVSEAVSYAETIKNLGYVNNALNSIKDKDLDFWSSELYYILAKKELDYASEMNSKAHGDSRLARTSNYEKLWEDYNNEEAQKELLDAQNKIRKEFFTKNGLSFTPQNPYNPKETLDFINNKYSFEVKNETIKSQNVSEMIRTSALNLNAYHLKENMKYEIIQTGIYKYSSGNTYEGVTLRDENGDVYLVHKGSIPGIQQLIDDRFNVSLNNVQISYRIDQLKEKPSSEIVSGDFYIEGRFISDGTTYYILHGKDGKTICVEKGNIP